MKNLGFTFFIEKNISINQQNTDLRINALIGEGSQEAEDGTVLQLAEFLQLTIIFHAVYALMSPVGICV